MWQLLFFRYFRNKSTLNNWSNYFSFSLIAWFASPLLELLNSFVADEGNKWGFSKDHNMYKDKLITLSVAQGYLNAEEGKEMEIRFDSIIVVYFNFYSFNFIAEIFIFIFLLKIGKNELKWDNYIKTIFND